MDKRDIPQPDVPIPRGSSCEVLENYWSLPRQRSQFVSSADTNVNGAPRRGGEAARDLAGALQSCQDGMVPAPQERASVLQ
jgi:hypothetical protein